MNSPIRASTAWAAHPVAIVIALFTLAGTSVAYDLSGKRWADTTTITLNLYLGDASQGHLPFNDAFEMAMGIWNEKLAATGSGVQLRSVRQQRSSLYNSTTYWPSPLWGNQDGSCEVFFGADVQSGFFAAGQGGRPYEEAKTRTNFYTSSGQLIEADVIFNAFYPWFPQVQGPIPVFEVPPVRPPEAPLPYSHLDVVRTALHEIGHVLGLGHTESYPAIMNRHYPQQETLTDDDFAGLMRIYAKIPVKTSASNQTVSVGQNVTLGVSAEGSGPFTYTWRLNGQPIPSAKPSGEALHRFIGLGGPTLAIEAITTQSAGEYSCLVRNTQTGEFTISRPTTVAVGQLPPRLINVSTRTRVEEGDSVMIAGFVVNNDGVIGAGTKRTLIRALGPSLIAAGVAGALSDPSLEIRDSTGALVASNDDWKINEAQIRATSLPPSNDREAAVVLDLAAGAYTAIVRGIGGQGVALVEVYDLQPAATNTRAINLSTRGKVSTGDSVMIAGFVINGTAPRRVAIRALGPSLSSAGIERVLQNPVLSVVSASGSVIASNDDWGSAPNKSELVATNLAPGNSLEAGLVLSLPPGAYTAIVSGAEGSSGVALVEVYELQ